ncbi:DUF341 domain protein [Lophiostoma macrostomum CBS 122681]|uniref:DUF341 domain protein n=1 Tax=Lophiostoma macrostomum CBS 122681 TaxID=1314788 RepID=A0A6A6STP1_9PLEO|nr:DUF341 domain protein [Lophiostoma macrostomum CBS 122681]
MRFLCLHGIGTNNHVLEIQTATIRYELGDSHMYEFVEGTETAPIASEIKSLYPSSDAYFTYFLPDSTSILRAIEQLDQYIAEEGPFDGAIGFSQGAGLLSTYLIKLSQESPQAPLPLKCAVFFSAASIFSLRELAEGRVKLLDPQIEGQVPLLSLPTAHIWGQKDEKFDKESKLLSLLCDKRLRHIFVHGEGHEIPSSRAGEAVQDD